MQIDRRHFLAGLTSGALLIPPPMAQAKSARCALPNGRLPDAVLRLVNAERRARGLAKLKSDSKLHRAAQSHACDNAARNIYSHYGSDGSDLSKRLKRAGFRPRIAVENTGLGFAGDSDRVMKFWMNSSKHRTNILHPKLRRFGLGVAQSRDGRTAWVLNLGTPL